MCSTFLLVSSFRSCQSGPSCPLKQKIPSFPMDFSDGSTFPTHPNTPRLPGRIGLSLDSGHQLLWVCIASSFDETAIKAFCVLQLPLHYWDAVLKSMCNLCEQVSFSGMANLPVYKICESIRTPFSCRSVCWSSCWAFIDAWSWRHHNHFYIETMAIGMATVDAAKASLLSCNPHSWI